MSLDAAGSDPTPVAGRYRLHEVLGAGGMGTVWRATDELLGREVALKQLRRTDLAPTDIELARARTMREARIAASLHHPHVVSIFDVLIENGEIWLVLEYVPSISLGTLIERRGPLPPSEVAAIGAQAAAALACAHAAGIVHRDVKPDNLLVTPTTSKLTDFGIAHAATASSLTATGLLTGTVAYLAPETARGQGTDARTDMFALGATLFAAVDGEPPFGAGGDLLVMITRIGRGGAPAPRNAGPLTGLIGHLLADDPAARPTAAQAHQVLAHLAHVARQAPGPPAFAPGPWPGTARPAPTPTTRSRRGRVVAMIVLGAVLLGTAVGAVALRAAGGGSAVPGVADPALGIADVRTADPCSLLDTAALSRFGSTELDPTNASFDGCRADITPPDADPVSVFAVLLGRLAPDEDLGGTPEEIGELTLARLPMGDDRCVRKVLLPDGFVISIFARHFGSTPLDLCSVADVAAVAATTRIGERAIATRTPPDVGTPLAGIEACTLLTPAELVVVPGLPPVGDAGAAGWSCDWKRSSGDRVEVYYYRSYPPSEIPNSTGVDIAGREAGVRASAGRCTVEFAQHYFTDATGARRAANIQIIVHGSAPGTELCTPATALARAAAGKLPPVS
ncbi:MAG: serine/threonine-protein kinase [Pseudonocardia sp.]